MSCQYRERVLPVEQLDLLSIMENDDLVETRLKHIRLLLELADISDLEIVAVNKHYEWSFLAKHDGRINCYSIYKNYGSNPVELRKSSLSPYSWEDVLKGRLNYIPTVMQS